MQNNKAVPISRSNVGSVATDSALLSTIDTNDPKQTLQANTPVQQTNAGEVHEIKDNNAQ